MELSLSVQSLNFDGLIIKFLRSGKILAVPEGSGFHFTLHPGTGSGNVDLHRTNEQVPRDHEARYETLITVPRAEILEKIRQLGTDHLRELLFLLRPIRLGWIARRRLGVVAFPTDSELNRVSSIRLTAEAIDNTELMTSWMRIPEFLDDIFELPNETFLLFDSAHPASPLYGLLFKLRGSSNGLELRWVKFRDLNRWSAHMKAHYSNVFGAEFLPEALFS